jgi:hypothetical protein
MIKVPRILGRLCTCAVTAIANGIAGLIDERGTRQKKPTIEDPFFEYVKSKWLYQRKWGIRVCWDQACVEAHNHGWMTRSCKQTVRFIDSLPHEV